MGTESTTNTPTNQEDYKSKATIDESGSLRRDLWGPRLFVRNNESKQSKSPKESDVKDPVITSPVKAVSSDHNKAVSKEQEASSKEQEDVSKEQVATSKVQEAVSKEQAATSKEQEAVSKEQEASSKVQEAVSKEQAATSKVQEDVSKEQAATSKEHEAVAKEQEAVEEIVSEQVQSLNIEEDQKPLDEENINSTAENSPKDNDDGRIEEVCKTSSELPPHADEKKVAKKNHVSPPEFSKKTKRHISITVRKSSASENALHAEEEDGCSSGYSSTTSMKSSNFQPTVAVGPSFVCGERAAKRKEYYAKLEEKRKAMEAEKMEAEARAKAEHEAALKELRKNLYIKAKPMPSFYKKGPPPKTEPTKVPPTRAKSPKLSQRKSIDSATQEDKQSIRYKLSGRSLDGKREIELKSDVDGVKSGGIAKSSKEERKKSKKVNQDAENGADNESVDSRVEEWLKYEKSEGENDVSSEVSHELHEGEDVGDMDGF